MNDDDDLPVLTQVLRTGNGRIPAAVLSHPVEPSFEALEVRPLDEHLLADELVIGHDPRQPTEPYLASLPGEHRTESTGDADEWPDADHAIVTDGADHFRLPHDHDQATGPTAAYMRTIVQPEVEFVTRDADPVIVPVAASPAPVDPLLGQKVRDAVIEVLMTRIDTELDARIAQVLHVEVETALAQLQAKLRAHLAEALRDVVSRAVDEELVRLNRPPDDHPLH